MEEKGLKIILDMDMDKFNSAINNIRNKTNAFNNDINKLKQSLKFDGSNVQQYTALVEKLRSKYNQTKSSIDDLKQILDASLESGKIKQNSSEWVNLTNKIITLEKNLKITERNINDITNDWEKNGKVGKETLNGLNRELTEQKTVWDKLKDGSNVFFGNLKANLVSGVISTGLNLIKSGISAVASAIKGLATGYINLISQGIEYNSKLQDYTKSLGIILNGDEQRAANVVQSLKKASAQLGVEIEPLVEGTQQLTIAGVGIEDASEAILGISKALKLVGADSGALQLVITNLMQLQTQGGATARDLREFATKGIPIYKLLAEYSERFAEGTYQAKDVKFEDVVGAILKAINDPNNPFSKSEEIIAETFSGQTETIRVRWQQLLGDLAEDTTSALTTKILPEVNNFLQSLIDSYDAGGFEALKETFINGFADLINTLSSEGVIEQMLSGVASIMDIIGSAFDPTTEMGKKNLLAVEEIVGRIIDGVVSFITKDEILDKFVDASMKIAEAVSKATIDYLNEQFRNWLESLGLDTDIGYAIAANRGNGRLSNSNNLSKNDLYGQNNISNNNSIVLNTNITVDSQINKDNIERIADTLTNRINTNLGKMVN